MTEDIFAQYRAGASFYKGATRATPAAARRTRLSLQEALAEVDGLFGGLQYLDKTEPLSHENPPSSSSSPQSAYDSSCPRPDGAVTTNGYTQDELALALDDLSTQNPQSQRGLSDDHTHDGFPSAMASSLHEPGKSQWAALRNVREASEFYYHEFKRVAGLSSSPVITELLQSYANARELREMGVLTFRDLLTGITPTSLKAIWAFSSLSYVISKLLFEKGRIAEEDILAGVRVWRDSIKNVEKKEAFNFLAERIWPEAKDHLHFISLEVDRRQAGRAREVLEKVPGLTNSPIWNNEILNDPRFYDVQVMPTSEEVMALPDYDGLGEPSSQWQSSEGEDYGVIDPQDYAFDFVYDMQKGICFTSTQIPHENKAQAVPEGPDAADEATSLRNTMAFLVILVFFQTTGELLYILSGKGLTTKEVEPGVANARVQSRFEKQVRKDFFGPRRKSSSPQNPAFTGLLSVAKKFVEMGYLRCNEDVHKFLISLARDMIEPVELFHEFLKWIYCPPAGLSPQFGKRPQACAKRERSEDDVPTSPSKKAKVFVCDDCERHYKTGPGLNKHRRAKHGSPPRRIPCPAAGCDHIGLDSRRDNLRQHVLNMHPGIDLPQWLNDRSRGTVEPVALDDVEMLSSM